jgi:putative Ca2+/H+ antiporter (TMEM165/GDT1 family)
MAATAIVAAGALALPSASYADITGITGGAIELASDFSGVAVELASATTQMMKSLTETGFYQAFSLVFLSEIGDKTFFMAGLLAMKTSKFISFLGSMAALAVMTVISVVIGQVFHGVPSGIAQGIPLDDLAAVLAFAFFGIKTLKDAIEMDPNASVMEEELADAAETVEGSSTVIQATKWYVLCGRNRIVMLRKISDILLVGFFFSGAN